MAGREGVYLLVIFVLTAALIFDKRLPTAVKCIMKRPLTGTNILSLEQLEYDASFTFPPAACPQQPVPIPRTLPIADGCKFVQRFLQCMDGKEDPPMPLYPLKTPIPVSCAPQSPLMINGKPVQDLTTGNMAEVLQALSTKNREIVFTTFARHGPQIAQWGLYLERVGMLAHALVIGESESDCEEVRAQCSRTPVCLVHSHSWLTNTNKGVTNQALSVHHKWWWASQFVRIGYDTIFMDDDAFPLVNLFTHWNRSYDYQGLSDLRFPAKTPAVPGGESQCHRLIYDGLGQCQSTGVMLMRATTPVINILHRMVYDIQLLPEEWEQMKWQKFTTYSQNWKYRLSPKTEIANIDDYLYQMAAGVPLNPQVIHMGYYHYDLKKKATACFGLVVK
eukprot:NODE_2286_length_1457_cov_140.212894_g2171_i0.p1 GENE.NODE_2286_length_1457_cov_140.212894_g2171_i0~~NODE_2286_length_1457_cov_140.212894_g2171_i0.p1  ORF type:complete len:391 (-),score=43.62 NODE_2286_length_1457_cov_140.212894_g2171_i0:233-1405(-)